MPLGCSYCSSGETVYYTDMLSIESIRDDPDRVRRAVELRGDNVDVGRILQLDEERRAVVHRGRRPPRPPQRGEQADRSVQGEAARADR